MIRSKYHIGQSIGGRYRVIDIKDGGMGTVLICEDYAKLRNVVVLKTPRVDLDAFAIDETKFEREAVIWTMMGYHPNIVKAFYVDRIDGKLFIVFEFIGGVHNDLFSFIHSRSALTLREVLDLATQFCYGMEYAYSKGVTAHGDIKSKNILLEQERTVKITDFGLAKALTLKKYAGTENSGPYGTLEYMAPEQFESVTDQRSDIYSFGVVLFELVAGGQLPFVSNTRTFDKYMHLHRHTKVPKLGSAAFPIIQRCLEKAPDKRFQGFEELRVSIQILMREKTDLLPPEAPDPLALEAWEWSNKGISNETMGNYEEALNCHERALSMNVLDPESWLNKGTVLMQLDQTERAIQCFEEAIKLRENYPLAWFNKGRALRNLGRDDEALYCYDKALSINPHFAQAWNNKGVIHFERHDLETALSCYMKAIQEYPEFTDACDNVGTVLGSIGKHAEAIEFFDRSIEINPLDANATVNKAISEYHLGNVDGFYLCYSRLKEIAPNSPQLRRLDNFKASIGLA